MLLSALAPPPEPPPGPPPPAPPAEPPAPPPDPSLLPGLLRSRPGAVGAGLVALAMGLIGFAPLFDGPGYESALVAGLLVPGVAAAVTALEISRHRPEPFEAFCRGAANGVALAALAWLATLAHGARVGFCDPLGGSAELALGPGVGAVLGGAWGAAAGEIAAGRRRRRLLAVLAAVAIPLGSACVSLVRFYTSPMIFAYDPFVGYFSGSLYDTVVDASGLLTYRAGSAATLFAAFTAALHLGRDARGRLSYQSIGRPGLLLLGAACLAASFAAILQGNRLGHWQTSETIAAELGALVEGERCDVVYPRATPVDRARRFARACDAHIAAGEAWLGAPALEGGRPLRIRAYLFENATQKGLLMGAARTYIAKPWRREVYLQEAGFPHPALGHEIMHVLAGAFARGPFRVAGGLGGLLPNPGLIEGLAVAGAPREGGDLTAREWAAAMKGLGLLPPLSRLFALGFFGVSSSTAYTASGAFVAYVRDRYGVDAVRAWYGGRALPDVTGASWDELERAWHADLDALPLSEAARAQAAAKFDKPAIFGRRCPHVVDACQQEADRRRGRGDLEGEIALRRRVLELDQDPATRVAMARAELAAGREGAGRGALEAIVADASLPRHVRDAALEALGDAALRAGDAEQAARSYREVMRRLVDEDRLRTLDVKIAVSGDPRARAAVVELLIGTERGDPDKVRAAELLGAWAEASPSEGLANYLMGRRYLNANRFGDAADRLDRALAAQIPIERVRAEAERLRLIVACGLDDPRTAERMLALYSARPSVPPARRAAAERLTLRCGGKAPGAAPP